MPGAMYDGWACHPLKYKLLEEKAAEHIARWARRQGRLNYTAARGLTTCKYMPQSDKVGGQKT